MANQNTNAVKKYLFEIYKEKYGENEEIIERICNTLYLNKDIEAFVKLITNAYETGFTTAVKQQTEQLKKFGVEVTVVNPKSHNSQS